MVEAIRQGDIPGVQLRCRQPLACPVAEGWQWLREPGRLKRWLASGAELSAADELSGQGAAEQLRLTGRDDQGTVFEEIGQTRSLIVQRRWILAFRRADKNWPAVTDLTFDLRALEAGCELSVLQHGFQRLPLSTCLTTWEAYRRRWRTALGRLEEAVARSSA
jgi:hypothetical protein